MNNFFKGILDFLSEPSGRKSSMRLMAVLSTLLILVIWTYMSFYNNEMVSIPNSIVHLLMILWGAKQIQRYMENGKKNKKSGDNKSEPSENYGPKPPNTKF